MKSKLILAILPIGIIGYCCWFFWYAFDRTMAQVDHEVPVVQFLVPNDASTNHVLYSVSKCIMTEITEKALTDRKQIAESEHTKFRAELATWLSIFGLLTMLVALIAPVCGLVFQRQELDKVQKSIDDIRARQIEINQTAKHVKDVEGEVYNTKASSDADREEDEKRENQDNLRSLLNSFKSIWGIDKTAEKIYAGIKLFEECNTTLNTAIDHKEYERLAKCLNILNNANAYLGMKNLAEFRAAFSFEMEKKRPLKVSNEAVAKALDDGHYDGPIKGFYNSALNLQGGMPG